jgi:dolichol-phosphate mannosyltransferase
MTEGNIDDLRKSCAIIMPAYNEEEALPDVLAEWCGAADRVDGTLIVLNDGSKDGTLRVLREAERTLPSLHVVDKPNTGHGPTCLLGYRMALDLGFEWIFQTDSDGQTSSEEFLEAWRLRDGADFVFGRRRSRGDGRGRKLISWVLRTVIVLVFRVHVTDPNVPFRLMRASSLRTSIDSVPDDLFLANAYLAVVLRKSPHRMQWMDISFSPRQAGSASVGWGRFPAVGLRVVKDFWKLRSH